MLPQLISGVLAYPKRIRVSAQVRSGCIESSPKADVIACLPIRRFVL